MGRGQCLPSGECQCNNGFSDRGCMSGEESTFDIQRGDDVFAPDVDPLVDVDYDKDY